MYKISAHLDRAFESYRVNGRTYRPILECTHFYFLSTQKDGGGTLNERETLRMALLLNKYPNQLISSQFLRVLEKFKNSRRYNG